MEISVFLYFLTASVLLTIAPGPDILYLLTKSISEGAKSGISLACGLVSGIFFHTMLVMLGIAALIQNSPTALTILKYFGAAYLLFLAYGAFKSSGKIKFGQADSKSSYFSNYKRGLLMNVLNPKVLLFFLAFLPQFIDITKNSVSIQIALLGLTFAIQALVIFSIIAFCAAHLRKIILKNKNLGKNFAIIEGTVLTGIAITLILN